MKKTKEKKPLNVEHELCKKIVVTFLKKGTRVNWPREIKMAKTLLKKFPFISDWDGIPEANRPHSLSFFLTPQGEKFLSSFKITKNFEFPPTETYNIGTETFGENKELPKFPKSIFDFINYGKEKR